MTSIVRQVGAALIAATAAFAFCGPAAAHEEESKGREIIIGDGDLLEKLIKLDEKGIADMRADIADARREIESAIAEVRKAREDVEETPGARLAVKIAFTAARAATEGVVDEVLGEFRKEIDDAERRLATMDISEGERAETQNAINGLREDLVGLEGALRALIRELGA